MYPVQDSPRIGQIAKPYLPNKGSLAGGNQACNPNELNKAWT